MYDEDDLVPLSALQHVVFCARRAALVHIEGAWAESASTVEGSIFHSRAHEVGTEVRSEVRIAHAVRLRSLRLGVTGQADVVEFHRLTDTESESEESCNEGLGIPLEGSTGLWKVYPVEYKVGRRRSERAYEVQLCGQAICLEEMLRVEIPAGAIFYGKTMRRLEVCFDTRLRAETESAAHKLHEMLGQGITPRAEYGKKCDGCSLLSLCMPKVAGGDRSVKSYIERSLRCQGGDTP
ncbi:MAG: CRISPR-associated protein Cas4 [Thermodesulfobacteriota bacterium]